MSALQIDGLGLVGGFGCGVSQLQAALERGQVEPSAVEAEPVQASLGTARSATFTGALPVYRADTSSLEHYLNKRVLRRIDHFSRMALLGAFQALEDVQARQQVTLDRSRLGVVLCSGFGALNTTFKFLDSVIDDGDPFASPTAFSNSVHNAAAAHISMQLGISGPGLTLSQFDHSFAAGLLQAQQWLEENRVDAVLLGIVDEYSSVLGYCWERFLGTNASTRMQPFATTSNTAVPGEGAAFFVLQPANGSARSYAFLEYMQTGNVRADWPEPDSAVLVLGGEGYPPTGAMYRSHLPATAQVACYTPLYGASPVATGFDVAVAALSLERGYVYPQATSALEGDTPWRMINTATAVKHLTCVDFSVGGEYSVISLAASSRCQGE
ncbi:MAG: beta-ketoacyl synthase N-terminal-like domain-containing protein [Desulfuromonadaceae bacterium]|nr:beta-ketoacyl synthase N-terminal-like domain-containing protein [Desulfuromonadaceae bacterium]